LVEARNQFSRLLACGFVFDVIDSGEIWQMTFSPLNLSLKRTRRESRSCIHASSGPGG
jgi:hypothetical protein